MFVGFIDLKFFIHDVTSTANNSVAEICHGRRLQINSINSFSVATHVNLRQNSA